MIALAIDGVQGDLWPLMAAYVTVADGLAFGACVGWLVGAPAHSGPRARSAREGVDDGSYDVVQGGPSTTMSDPRRSVHNR